MSDTQWKANLDGENPETVAVGIIKQINQEFIRHGVEFVIQVGDLTDKETDTTNGNPDNRTMDTRADAAQQLYDAGICFFPLRGNHESSGEAANEMPSLFPQTSGAGMTCAAKNFSSPMEVLEGLSYAFDYNNATFVLLDQFTRKDGSNNNDTSNDNMLDQLDWIASELEEKGRKRHGFVFSHKELIGANHSDILFGSNPAVNAEAQNVFYKILEENGVRYEIGGHDHNHMRSIMLSPDGKHQLQNIITASNSYKFYTPRIPSNDDTYNLPAFGFQRETPISQELYSVGYYIVTVDGPRVTVDHYASDNGCGGVLGASVDCRLTTTPALEMFKRETFGYSLNGREFRVAQGDSYTVVEDSFAGTHARILDGVNDSLAMLMDGRPTIKDINTGWVSKVSENNTHRSSTRAQSLASHVLTLWGMAELGETVTDTYVLSMSYDRMPRHLGRGSFALVSKDSDGNWVNAVNNNSGGEAKFVVGPWSEGDSLGTYGVDPVTKTVWAVINSEGDFAVGRDIPAAECNSQKHARECAESM
ncbi:MAG: metallophosphoesterase [Candidatus Thiodiazotropha sp.]